MEDKIVRVTRDAVPVESGLDLKSAIRRARIEQAERSDVASDLRAAEYAKLDMLKDQLEPVFAQIPAEADLFDHGLIPGERPRYYIDMVAFVEMSRDRRTYRFLRDTRNVRQLLGESDDLVIVSEAVTAYLGHRLVEREKALASYTAFAHTSPDPQLSLSGAVAPSSTTAAAQNSEPPNGLRSFGFFVLGVVVSVCIAIGYAHWETDILPVIAEFTAMLGAR